MHASRTGRLQLQLYACSLQAPLALTPGRMLGVCCCCPMSGWWCRQVHNPPTAQPITLTRRALQPCDSSSSGDVLVGPESVKSCYELTQDSLQRLRGVSPAMSTGRTGSSKQQLLDWRPYLKQVCTHVLGGT